MLWDTVPLSRRSLCRNWHLARDGAGCRASQGRIPPPLSIRQRSSIVDRQSRESPPGCQAVQKARGQRERFARGGAHGLMVILSRSEGSRRPWIERTRCFDFAQHDGGAAAAIAAMLRQVELPGHAVAIAHPGETAAETVVVERHECRAAVGQGGDEALEFVFGGAIDEEGKRGGEGEVVDWRAVEAADRLIPDPERR